MAKLFLDANVLFTAAHSPKGKAAFLFDAALPGRWTLLASEYTVEEARRNIASKYPACLERLELLVRDLRIVPHQASFTAAAIDLPEKDLPVYLSALHGKATHLLTGDLRHFGPQMKRPLGPRGLLIQTVADFLAGQ